MSGSELQDVLKSLDDLVEQEEQEQLNNELHSLDNLISKLEAAAQVKTPEPIVKWKKRDVDGNQIFERPKASRNLPNQAGPSRRKAPRVDAPDTDCEMVFAPVTVAQQHKKMLQTASANSVGAIQLLSVVMTADHALSSVLNVILGRSQQTEWEAVRFEVENICKEESFICPACTPDMLAVSVDGNHKHYRFKHAARSEEKATFEGVFIAKDEELTRFVDYIHRTTKHVSGRGVCGGEWSAARETSQRSTSKVDEEGLELAVKWSGAYQDGAGLTLGEEVEQCKAFLSRIAVTTKHMTKAGRTHMLTLMAMR
ncbi:hypothetical protein NQZ68_026432 [Dissostichus eleginoides]|nr:hypothetical protein NQZ68_026432 [Dissostichus eleginoides]